VVGIHEGNFLIKEEEASMKEAKFAYQIWDRNNQIVKDGFGNAATLERFAEIVQQTYVGDDERLGWTVWHRQTKEYLEYRGSTLVDKGRDAL
jgi:hypothetical protein